MTTTQPQTPARSEAFLTRALELFCAEISATFDICMASMVHVPYQLTANEVEATLEILSAAITVTVSGDVSGDCYVLFDKDAIRTLGSAIETVPDGKPPETKQDAAADTDSLCDAVVEIGNLLVHSLDGVSGDFFTGSVLFAQTDAVMGDDHDRIRQALRTDDHQHFLFIPCNITLNREVALTCGIIMPESLDRQIAKERIPEQACPAVDAPQPQPSAPGPVIESIQKMVQSLPELSDRQPSSLIQIPAEQIMRTNTVWACPDDNVQQAMDQLIDTDAYCLLIGREGKLDGIVTWIDLAGVSSIYLQPMFKQWRRPADDATLRIKLNVIMTSPVRTATPDTPLKILLTEMTQYRLDCIPLVDENAVVRGVVTTADIFRLLLSEN